MPTPTKGARLGAGPAHERLLLANLATSLFQNGRITTTEAKARRLRPYAERLITKAKRGDLHNRREIMKVIRDKDVVQRLMTEIGPFFSDRAGGYTRIIKVMPRRGDNASMAVIELIQEKTVTAEAEAARKTKFAADEKKTPGQETPVEDAKVDETPVEETEATDAAKADQDAEAPKSATSDAAEAPAEGADGKDKS